MRGFFTSSIKRSTSSGADAADADNLDGGVFNLVAIEQHAMAGARVSGT